ncbi:hypothetical protein [Paeniglutamicibacter psychrophenolicus]|uniref:Uncharacterized protein n=1 Tax=Paeniglutamicibacter psychrophenolicus TaxID=257454 RepID=A0ABS4WAA5_9MICC|nr:hypothetical protein [Paeniglutamicibacter psychrophenolicus]MBP2373127.1 hypothetical protein [Paeniglutamicibacter psychrophenolicus]
METAPVDLQSPDKQFTEWQWLMGPKGFPMAGDVAGGFDSGCLTDTP